MDAPGFAGGVRGCISLSGLARGCGRTGTTGTGSAPGLVAGWEKPSTDPKRDRIPSDGERPRAGPCSAGG